MIDLNPYNKSFVPFVVEQISPQSGNDVFSVDIKEKSKPSARIVLPADEITLLKIIDGHKSSRKALDELLYFDLMFDENYCNGVYIFFEGDKCRYVGSNASRSIVERVGGHLALRQRDYMNCMVKYLTMRYHPHRYAKQVTSSEICTKDVLDALSEMSILFIPVGIDDKANVSGITLLEDYMIHLLQPSLQDGKKSQVKKKYNW